MEVVDRERDVIAWRERETRAQVDGCLLLQRLSAEDARCPVVHREIADLDKLPADHVGRGVTEVTLSQPWCSETGARCPAQRESLSWLIAQRQLPCEALSEVAVVLESRGDVAKKLVGELTLQIDIGAHIRPAVVAGVCRRKTWKDRRSRRGGQAVIVSGPPDAVNARAVLRAVVAVDP